MLRLSVSLFIILFLNAVHCFGQENDAFARRIVLSGAAVTAISDNSKASRETGEPIHGGVGAATRSLWWSWMAPATGTVNFSTFGSAMEAAATGPVLALYTGETLATLREVASSNNQPDFLVYDLEIPEACFNAAVTAGTTYQIALAGRSENAGRVVLEINQTPTIVSDATRSGSVGEPFRYAINASNKASSFDATGLPAGLAVNPFSGVISGVPGATGRYAVNLTASNLSGTGTAILILTIDTAEAAPALQLIYSAPVASGWVGGSFFYSINATGNPVSYNATGLPPGIGINRQYGWITGRPETAGFFPVTLSAANATGTSEATLGITITSLPPAPVIESSAVADGKVGSAFKYAISGDFYVPNSQFGASNLPAGLSVDPSTGYIRGVPVDPGSYRVPISVSHGGGEASGTLTITIRPAGAPSSVRITSANKVSGVLGADFTYAITAEGSPAEFDASGLPPGLSVNKQSGYVTGKSSDAGFFPVLLTARKGAEVANATIVISIGAPLTSATSRSYHAVIHSSAGAVAYIGEPFGYRVSAEFLQSAGSQYIAMSGLPPGLSANTTGLISGVPATAGTFSASITASVKPDYFSEAIPVADAVLTIRVEARAPDSVGLPLISSSVNITGIVGQSFGHVIQTVDGAASFGATGLPPGLTLNTSSGSISGLPTQAGNFPAIFSASNGAGTGSAAVTIRIAALPPLPSFGSAAAMAGTVGTYFNHAIEASEAPNTYSASNLPAGLALNATSGAITGVPSAEGLFLVPITATNLAGTRAATLTLTIARSQGLPLIVSSAVATGIAGSAFSYQAVASSGAAIFEVGALPAGFISINPSGKITGTPLNAGTFTVPINVSDAAGTTHGILTIVIAPSVASPVLSSSAAAAGNPNSAFSYRILASNSPSNYGASNLPAGLAIDSLNGQISGTLANPGVYVIPISATNAGGTSEGNLTLSVAPALPQPAPVISSAAAASGVLGAPFNYTLAAANSPSSFGADNLPPGLSIAGSTGIISGTPAAGGAFSAKVWAVNSTGVSSAVLLITIATAPSATPVISNPIQFNGYLGEQFSYVLSASNLPSSFTVSALPPGLALEPATGRISGVPTAIGTTTVAVSASNLIGTGMASVQLRIYTAARPRITSSAAANAVNGVLFNYSIRGSNSPNSYSANGLPSGLVLNTSTGVISGKATENGIFACPVTANGSSATAYAILTITVASAPVPQPVISSSAAVSGYATELISYQIAASGSPVSFGASGLPFGLTLDSATGLISGTLAATGEYSATISATNGFGSSAAKLKISVLISPGSVKFLGSAAVAGTTGLPFSYTFSYNDALYPSNLTGSLPPGLSFDSVPEPKILGTPSVPGRYPVTISGRRLSTGSTATASVVIEILDPASVPPVISSPLSATGFLNGPFVYKMTALGAASFQASNLPAGLLLDSATGILSGRPRAAGTYLIPIVAVNSKGGGNALLNLSVAEISPKPVISSAVAARSVMGVGEITYRILTSNSPVSYAAQNLPPGLTLDTNSGVVSGTALASGTYFASISASNSGGTSNAAVTFTIVAAPAIPVMTGSMSIASTAGSYFSSYITASNLPASFGATGLPPGLALSPASGVISGYPTVTGEFLVTCSAANAGGTAVSKLTIVIGIDGSSGFGVFTRSTVNAMQGRFLLWPIWPPDLQFSEGARVEGLPPGLFFDTEGDAIMGTPTVSGTFPVTLLAVSSTRTYTAILTLEIAPLAPPVITAAASATGSVGVPISYAILASDGNAGSFSASGLPPGLMLNAQSGAISGKPLVAGNFDVSVSAANAAGTGSAVIRIRIAAAGLAVPVISSAASLRPFQPYDYHNRVSPEAAVDYAILATENPISYSAGALPPGLSFNPATGVISGTLTSAGVYRIPISATNSKGTGTALLTIDTTASPPELLAESADAIGMVGKWFSYAMNYKTPLGYNEDNGFVLASAFSAIGLPPGLSINTATGLISGIPSLPGIYPATVSAANIAGGASSFVSFLITAPEPVLELPVFHEIKAALGAAVAMPFSYVFAVDDASQNLTAAGLPRGLTFISFESTQQGGASKAGRISGIPEVAGVFPIQIFAQNSAGIASATVTLSIAAVPPAPEIYSAAAASGTASSPFSYAISASGLDLGKSYGASNLPAGLQIDGATGIISGTPSAAGRYAVPIWAAIAGVQGNATVQITIAQAPGVLPAPAIAASAGAVGFLGVPFEYNTGTRVGPSTIGSLPPGVNFNPATGLIAGVPSAEGRFEVPFSLSTAGGTTDAVVTITILPALAALPFFTLEPLSQSIGEGGDVTLAATAFGVPAPVFQWKHDGILLPAILSGTLRLTGATLADAGNYSVTISNPAGSVTSQDAAIVVTATIGAWRSSHFSAAEISAGEAADNYSLRRDGVSNLMNYALGRDPRTGAGGKLPVVSRGAGEDYLRVEFSRDTRKSDIGLIVEASSDLVNWTPIAASLLGAAPVNMGGARSVTESTGVIRSVVVEDNAQIGAIPRRYLRLKVSH